MEITTTPGEDFPGRTAAMVNGVGRTRDRAEGLAEVAHDARNVVTALGLYCDLLGEPGVLTAEYRHYRGELRLLASASYRLVEKLTALQTAWVLNSLATQRALESADDLPGIGPAFDAALAFPALASAAESEEQMYAAQEPVEDLAERLLAHRDLLATLAGPEIKLSMQTQGGKRPVRMAEGDLTRILVNLVKNATEAMPAGGRIRIALRESEDTLGAAGLLVLTVDDIGSGIPAGMLRRIFERGFTTWSAQQPGDAPPAHRGFGLAVTRSLVEAAGGRIFACNRSPLGTRLQIELPFNQPRGNR